MVRLVSALLLASCARGGGGSSDGGQMPAADAAARGTDAAPRVDAAPGACLSQVPVNYSSPTPFDTSQSSYPDGDYTTYTFFADLAPESERMQRLFIVTHPETGVFTEAVKPGTYILDGDETDYSWCSACVYLAVDDDGSAPSVLYMAKAGKLQIDNVGEGIHGRLSSVDLVQIDIVYEGPSCEGEGEWPCGNSGCSGPDRRCGVQVEVPACGTHVGELTF